MLTTKVRALLSCTPWQPTGVTPQISFTTDAGTWGCRLLNLQKHAHNAPPSQQMQCSALHVNLARDSTG